MKTIKEILIENPEKIASDFAMRYNLSVTESYVLRDRVLGFDDLQNSKRNGISVSYVRRIIQKFRQKHDPDGKTPIFHFLPMESNSLDILPAKKYIEEA